MRSTTSSVTAWIDAARSISRWVSSDSGARGGPPKSSSKRPLVIRSEAEVVEVATVRRERAVVVQVDEVLEDGVDEAGLAVGGEAHQLVLARVHPEAAVVGEGRVEEAERVREVELADHLDLVAPAHADAGGGPLADPVEGEDRGAVERRRVEGRGGVALVVLGEPELVGPLVAQRPELGLDLVADPELLPQPQGHGPVERAEADRGACPRRCAAGGRSGSAASRRRRRRRCRRGRRRRAPGSSATACSGNAASCLMRVNRSSWAAATSSPSTTRAAAESW